MRLKKLISNLNYRRLENVSDCEIKGVSSDSNCIRPGYLFVAIKGERVDGHSFINQAIDKGARAVIMEKDSPRPFNLRRNTTRQKGRGLPLKNKVAKILVQDSQAAPFLDL